MQPSEIYLNRKIFFFMVYLVTWICEVYLLLN